jgi:hypothetical protein
LEVIPMRPRDGARPADGFDFTWRRPAAGAGFRWQPNRKYGGLLVGPPQHGLLPYQPLAEETGLFLAFARLGDSQEEFLRFANAYGRLGTYFQIGPDLGEPLDEWQRHQRWMRHLTDLRDECDRDWPHLGPYVGWAGDELAFRFPPIGEGSSETWRHRGELRVVPRNNDGPPLFRRGEVLRPARWLLSFAIDDWLQELHGMRRPVAPRMVWSEADSQAQLVFGPTSLLGAMVCQLAAAVHRGWPFQECARCHRFFRLEPGVNRANRRTCSHTCKQYLYNQRVQRAQSLHAEGWTVPAIVKELQVKPQGKRSGAEVVRTWIDRR